MKTEMCNPGRQNAQTWYVCIKPCKHTSSSYIVIYIDEFRLCEISSVFLTAVGMIENVFQLIL